MAQILTNEPIPLALANPDLPLGIEPVLLQALDKKPQNRYPSCQTFAEELGKSAQAYVAASDQYEQARKYFDAQQWRQALAAFETLREQAPGFKDTARCLEQARHQVQLLEFYEQAQEALKRHDYQDALDTLNALTKLAPEYDVAHLRQLAHDGLAQKQRQTLDGQYQKAVEMFQQ